MLPGSIFSYLPLTRVPSICSGHLIDFKVSIMELDHAIVELSKLDFETGNFLRTFNLSRGHIPHPENIAIKLVLFDCNPLIVV